MTSGAELVEVLSLDTSAYSHLRGGHAGVVDLVAQASQVVIPTVVLGELEAAFRLGTRLAENLDALDAFLLQPWVAVADVTRDVARRFGQLAVELRRRGTPIPSNDVWIAATSLARNARVVTFDSDFARIPGLDPIIR